MDEPPLGFRPRQAWGVAARTSADCSICDGAATSPAVATLLLADKGDHQIRAGDVVPFAAEQARRSS